MIPQAPPFLIRNHPAVREILAVESEPLGKGATEDLYRHRGATEPYRGGFAPAPKPKEAIAPPADKMPEYHADAPFEDERPAPFTDEENTQDA